jgi:hypothetical protein
LRDITDLINRRVLIRNGAGGRSMHYVLQGPSTRLQDLACLDLSGTDPTILTHHYPGVDKAGCT